MWINHLPLPDPLLQELPPVLASANLPLAAAANLPLAAAANLPLAASVNLGLAASAKLPLALASGTGIWMEQSALAELEGPENSIQFHASLAKAIHLFLILFH